jgi:hypothetical protein
MPEQAELFPRMPVSTAPPRAAPAHRHEITCEQCQQQVRMPRHMPRWCWSCLLRADRPRTDGER